MPPTMSVYPLFITAFVFGVFGSIGHCAVMCGAVQVLLARRGLGTGWRLVVLHIGRLLTYSTLGLLAGAFGEFLKRLSSDIALLQGVLAFIFALGAGYFALSLVSKLPSPELLLAPVTRQWGSLIRQLPAGKKAGMVMTLVTGLLWGALPCGFVLAALIPAAATGNAADGIIAMMAFGFGTLPVLLIVNWLANKPAQTSIHWARPLSALAVALFGTQMALRALASWSIVEHMMIAQVMLW